MATPTVENLIQGPGWLYHAPTGTSEPADDTIHDEPGGDWTDVGITTDGVTININQEYSELEADQIYDVPGRTLVAREAFISTNMAEATLENLELALNGGVTATGAAGANASGFKSLEPGDPGGSPDYFMVIFDGIAPNGLVRRVLVRRALAVGEVEAQYTKDGQTVYSVELHAHYVSRTVKPWRVVDQTAEPTG